MVVGQHPPANYFRSHYGIVERAPTPWARRIIEGTRITMKNKLSVVLALAALCGIARGEDQATKDLNKAALNYQGTLVAESSQTAAKAEQAGKAVGALFSRLKKAAVPVVEAAKTAATPEATKALQALAEAEAAKQRMLRSMLSAAEKAVDTVAAEKTPTPAKQ
jgi:hypothetical protein